jgi:hypothetical protein
VAVTKYILGKYAGCDMKKEAHFSAHDWAKEA